MPPAHTDLSLKAILKQLALPIAVAAITAGTTNAFGGLSLTKIPTVLTDTSNEGRCITVDGKFVGGLSGTANGFLYDVAKGNVIRPVAGSYAQIITGIAWRTDTAQGKVQLILDGENNGYQCRWATSDAGTNWAKKFIDNGYSNYAPPSMNSLAGKVGSPDFYWTYRSSDKSTVFTKYALSLWDDVTIPGIDPSNGKQVNPPDKVYSSGIATTGRMIGYRLIGDLNSSGSTNVNNLWDYPPASGTSYQWNGLDGTKAGEAWSVSQNGTIIFGRSPITPGTIALYAYKAVVTAAPNPTQLSVKALPELPRTMSGGGLTRAVPYGCTGDGKYAVGYFFPSATLAALWDTSNANPANWKATDLTALAAAYGAGVPDVFSSLTKAYSVGIDGTNLVITGFGVEAGTGNNRAFVMRVPKTMAAAGFSQKPTLKFSGSYPAGLMLSYFTEPGATSYVEFATNITPPSTWTVISTNVATIGSIVTVPDLNPSDSRRFYRVRIDP